MPNQPLVIGFGGGIRQDLHRSALPPGAVYRAKNVRRRSGGALGPRTDLPTAGLATRANSFQMFGAAQAIGERAGNQVIAAGLSVWEREGTGDSWTETGRATRFQPLRADLVGPIDSRSALGHAGPLAHQWVAAIGDLVAVAYATSTSAVFEVRTESGQVVSRFVENANATASSQVMPRIVALPGASTAGKFVFLWYKVGTGTESVSYDVATDTLGPISVVGGVLFNDPDGYDARELSTTQYLLAYKKDATTFSVKRLDADSNVLAILTPGITAGNLRPNAISISGTVGESVYLLFAVASVGTRGIVFDSNLSAVTKAETLILTETANDVFTRPAVCRINASSRWYMQHSVTVPGTPPNSAFDKIQTFSIGSSLFAVARQTFTGASLSSLPECTPDGVEASFWVDYQPPRIDGHRSALISTFTSGLNTPRLIELTTDRIAGGSTHKPPIAHGTTADWYASNVILSTNLNLGLLVAPQVVGYVPSSKSSAAAARVLVEAAGCLNVCGGGVITECWGENGRHGNGFSVRLGVDNGLPTPIAFGSLVSGGGSIGAGTYQYCVVFEYIDALGRVHRSSPSNILTVNATGSNTVMIRFSTVEIGDRQFWQSGSLSAHIYRTAANGSTFYRITSNTSAPSAFYTFSGYEDYSDTAADATITAGQILYTSGSVLANQPAPAHRFATFGDGRIWTAGTWDPTRIECSKLIVPGEPVQFTRSEAFRTYLPDPVTALAYMDGNCVAWTERGVYLIPGSGPDDEGGSPLPAPTRIPGDDGCIEPRSVLEVSQGILFQSDRGLHLLPRGFGSPTLISAAIQDDFAGQRVLGAVRIHYDASMALASGPASMGSKLIALLLGSTTLILDDEKLDWVSVDTYSAAYAVAGTWGGRLALAAASLTPFDTTTLLLEADTFAAITASVETGDIAPFGLFGTGRVRGVQALVELRGDTRFTLGIVYDGQYPPLAPESHPLDQLLPAGSEGIRTRMQFRPAKQVVESVRLALDWTVPNPATPTQTALVLGVCLEGEAELGTTRVPPSRRA